ncbi:MAG: hypothetical protein CM1200mP41_34940 [Gammaproteobacteria bacterium]|nr:MAG: hypothetical protein CM1200mP41_34940 [Gammaproteobacteria bacterium]
MTNTVSDFGKEYDSLVDVIAFGLTPALLLYQWGLKDLGKMGWLIAFFYVARPHFVWRALIRKAARVSDTSRGYRVHGGRCLASGVWTLASYQFKGELLTVAAMILMLLLGLAMVSTLPYRSFKDLDLRNRVPFVRGWCWWGDSSWFHLIRRLYSVCCHWHFSFPDRSVG